MMDIYKKLELHLEESTIHTARLLDVLNVLEKLYPLNNTTLETISIENKDKLDVLAFRFHVNLHLYPSICPVSNHSETNMAYHRLRIAFLFSTNKTIGTPLIFHDIEFSRPSALNW